MKAQAPIEGPVLPRLDVVEEEEECTMSVQTGLNPRGVKRKPDHLEDDTAGGRASGGRTAKRRVVIVC